MRLGGPILEKYADPDAWVMALRKEGYGAAYCPVDEDADAAAIPAYARAAAAAGIVIAEVGAWSNPLSIDEKQRREAITLCQSRLALADQIGARCCVNIAGSRGPKWDGPCGEDLTDSAFDLIVESVREIIDAVRPVRTFYTLETMPWMYPNSADSYLRLIEAIDRDRFAAHLDPVNLINSPERYFGNAAVIRECFEKLGPHIRSCHAKDILLSERLTVHLDEVPPGKGALDYRAFLEQLDRLDADMPLMMEHMEGAEYVQAARYIRSVAEETGIRLL